MDKKLCEIAKIEGKFSNHSLRATSTTRMFQQSVPEQVIKEITGHKSDAVRLYKRTNNDLLKQGGLSICGSNVEQNEINQTKDVQNVEHKSVDIESETSVKVDNTIKESLSACQMIKNVVRTRMEMRKKNKKVNVGKIVKSEKKKLVHRVKYDNMKCSKPQHLVIDLNVNLHCKK